MSPAPPSEGRPGGGARAAADRSGAAGPSDPTAARIGILTISDGVYHGAREDRSGALIARWVEERGYEERARAVVPDEPTEITRTLLAWADREGCDLIVTTGGTGLADRDTTPEATRAAIEREAPGLAERIRAVGTEQTPFAALGRGLAGVRGRTLIVNLPGSPSGVRDGLSVLSEVADHAVEILRGRTEHD